MKKKNRGFDEFDRYFKEVYLDRWPHLLSSLREPHPKSVMLNPFASLTDEERHALLNWESGQHEKPFRTSNGLYSHYILDQASKNAANAIPIKKGDRILDMCAAPGGKALGMLFRSIGNCHFVLNERSNARRARLHRVIEDYIPAELRENIKITSHDATKWCLHEKEAYDVVLLDAPCSSEQHLLEKPTLLAEWSRNRTRALAIQQFAMLASGTAALKSDGQLLYATCSISPEENDGVIKKLLKKRTQFEVAILDSDFGEPTECGVIFLPDKTRMGPLYMALVKRTS